MLYYLDNNQKSSSRQLSPQHSRQQTCNFEPNVVRAVSNNWQLQRDKFLKIHILRMKNSLST